MARDVGETEERKAALQMVEQDRLLPGEPPDADDIEDVELWVGTYSEILPVKEALLAQARRAAERLETEAARAELGDSDAVVLDAEVRRLRHRAAFWRQRLEQVRGHGA